MPLLGAHACVQACMRACLHGSKRALVHGRSNRTSQSTPGRARTPCLAPPPVGPPPLHWHRRVPGDAHRGDHSPDHQAQLPCDGHCGPAANHQGGVLPGQVGPPGCVKLGMHGGGLF
eukprot:145676-Chlamydomonas_euryale.AAC.2